MEVHQLDFYDNSLELVNVLFMNYLTLVSAVVPLLSWNTHQSHMYFI